MCRRRRESGIARAELVGVGRPERFPDLDERRGLEHHGGTARVRALAGEELGQEYEVRNGALVFDQAPELDRAIHSRGCDPVSARAEERRPDRAVVAERQADDCAGAGIPDAGGPIEPGGREEAAVGTERDVRDRAAVLERPGQCGSGGRIPDDGGSDGAGRGNATTVGAEGGINDRTLMPERRARRQICRDIPDAGGAVFAGRDHVAGHRG